MAKNRVAAPKAKGKKEVRAKLTDHEVDLIRELVEQGLTVSPGGREARRGIGAQLIQRGGKAKRAALAALFFWLTL